VNHEFRWIPWNAEHAGKHGVSMAEAELVVNGAQPPYPEYRGDEKWLVIGRGLSGRFVQVIYMIDDDGTLFVIHARPLTEREKRRYRRRTR
jgi:uncharacterized DUF497 family protein